MARELAPERPAAAAPRGCVLALLLTVALATAALVVLALTFRARYPGADPF